MRNGDRSILVSADWDPDDGPKRMGTLFVTNARGKEVFSFEYDPDWLTDPPSRTFDPRLQYYPGRQYAANDQNFGLFLDSSPDRWGRVLMRRREAQSARQEERKELRLQESDYLLGVHDGHRMGALRFQLDEDGPFLDDNARFASPPWASLRELEQASLQLEADGAEDDPEYAKWLSMLIAPGASLGGARPKASIVDPEGQLWIAKFPSRNDQEDVGAWEQVAMTLARRAGLNTPKTQVQRFGSPHHTFLSQRFDRRHAYRLQFASALTLLERKDGDDHTDGVSYLELVDVLLRDGAQTDQDLHELWRRIVFNICISNTDDHLRNHGFLLTTEGWRLSPLYDVNPSIERAGLVLNISETDNAQDLDLAREVAPYFRLDATEADPMIEEVLGAVRTWSDVAGALGVSASSQQRMESAFSLAQ